MAAFDRTGMMPASPLLPAFRLASPLTPRMVNLWGLLTQMVFRQLGAEQKPSGFNSGMN